jgi:hypothetical protein
MTTIQLDDHTAEALAAIARSKGLTVQLLLASLVGDQSPISKSDEAADFEAELGPLWFNGPSLPSDFSRADIYSDL